MSINPDALKTLGTIRPDVRNGENDCKLIEFNVYAGKKDTTKRYAVAKFRTSYGADIDDVGEVPAEDVHGTQFMLVVAKRLSRQFGRNEEENVPAGEMLLKAEAEGCKIWVHNTSNGYQNYYYTAASYDNALAREADDKEDI